MIEKKLGLYVHIPFCKMKCSYCSFVSICKTDLIENYLYALSKQMQTNKEKFSKHIIDSIFIGGGTPSLLEERCFDFLCKNIFENFNVKKEDLEFSVECNPESLTKSKLDCYVDCGVNRVSVGVQSFEDEILQLVGRLHNSKQAINCIDMVANKVKNLSIDLMIGLPKQKIEHFETAFSIIKQFDIKHISAYGLSMDQETDIYKLKERNPKLFVEEDELVEYYDYIYDSLKKMKINRYEVSNFAKIGFECKHNLKYWNLNEYLGLGVSAHSFAFGNRFETVCDVNQYIDLINNNNTVNMNSHKIDEQEQKFEYVMLKLRTENGINFEEYQNKFNCSFLQEFKDKITKIQPFLNLSVKGIRVSENSYYVLNSILAELL